MRINVGPLKGKKGESLHFTFSEALASPWGGEAELETPVTVDVTVTNTGKCYLVRGRLSTRASLVCDRCLTRFTTEIASDIEEEFYPQAGVRRPARAEQGWVEEDEPSPDAELNTFTGDVFDLTGTVEELLVVALPVKVLCSEACRGICPRCGANLNAASCRCGEE